MGFMQNKNPHNLNKSGSRVHWRLSGWLLAVPTIILFVLLVWRPIGIAIKYAFYDLQGMTPVKFVGLENFRDVLSDTNFIQTLKNTVSYVFWSLVIGLPLPFFSAVMINEMIHGKGFFKFTLYMPVIMPGIVTSLLWTLVYSDGSGGLLNMVRAFFGLEPAMWLSNRNLTIPLIIISMTWNSFGGTMIMYLATLQGVDTALYEAARIDGAGFWTRFKVVLMPHMLPTVLLLAVRQIIGVFNVTEQPMIMTGGGPNGASLSLGLTNYYYAFSYGHFDRSMALGLVTFVMLLGLTFVYYGLEKKISR